MKNRILFGLQSLKEGSIKRVIQIIAMVTIAWWMGSQSDVGQRRALLNAEQRNLIGQRPGSDN